ncbi:hypothetical protein B9Z19DRAFT_382672 [Tuber borchii]|uniref:Uncharacterized protein n=1 Tax=Tuber borchii TaxID=42251 RepID=A0A2T7A446_TUBBO|nr:hypothetical protein B9Z19DRAFT_382672 [Tuber borchii]
MAHTSLRFLLLVFSGASGIKPKPSRINQTFLPPLSLFPHPFASVLHDQVSVQQPCILPPFFWMEANAADLEVSRSDVFFRDIILFQVHTYYRLQIQNSHPSVRNE